MSCLGFQECRNFLNNSSQCSSNSNKWRINNNSSSKEIKSNLIPIVSSFSFFEKENNKIV